MRLTAQVWQAVSRYLKTRISSTEPFLLVTLVIIFTEGACLTGNLIFAGLVYVITDYNIMFLAPYLRWCTLALVPISFMLIGAKRHPWWEITPSNSRSESFLSALVLSMYTYYLVRLIPLGLVILALVLSVTPVILLVLTTTWITEKVQKRFPNSIAC